MLRVFIAVTLPEDALAACGGEARRVEEALGPVRRAVKFARPEGLHFTLKFLGWTPEETVEKLRPALERAAAQSSPFPLALRGLEAFPTPRRPRVIYLSVVEGAEPMKRLAEHVEAEVSPLGYPPEARAFTPHVTLGRVKDPKSAAKIGERIAALAAVDVARVEIGKLSLMLSQLHPAGSIYTELAAFPLKKAIEPRA